MDALEEHVRPGVTTLELNEIDHQAFIAWPALSAWAAGVAVSYGSQAGYFSLMNLEAVEATLAAMLVYYLLKLLGRKEHEAA